MELALCFSGGGYRAALFHLGVLTFLDELKIDDNTPLLNHVHTITSISGGALTGMTYVISEIDHCNRNATFKRLYHDIISTNIGQMLLDRFHEESKKNKSLIQTLADIYDDCFFHGDKFGHILNGMSWDGIHHFYADATDFALSQPFRFQATARLSDPNRITEYGMIGNWQHNISYEDAGKMRLADIMAATSCFPLVFEPIEYPKEFTFSNGEQPRGDNLLTIPLMDGGMIDNQGIEPAIHARNQLIAEGKDIDLIIICDAGTTANDQEEKDWNLFNISPRNIFAISAVVGILGYISVIFSVRNEYPMMCVLMTAVTTVAFMLCVILSKVDTILNSLLETRTQLSIKKSVLWRSSLKNIGTFFKSRVMTAYKMSDVVMSGNQKKLWYRSLRRIPELTNKIQMNSISLFSKAKTWKSIVSRQNLERSYRPDDRMKGIAQVASSTKTSLWFSVQQLHDNVPAKILACGRFTTCWNLLVYIEKLKNLQQNERTAFHDWMIAQEQPILEIWNKFKQNPMYNIKKYTE